MTCSLCRGMGNLFNVQDKKFEWWTCQACSGAGARFMFGPPTMHIHNPSKGLGKHLKKIAKEMQIEC